MWNASPKYLRNIESQVEIKFKLLRKPKDDILESKQIFLDEVLKIYKEAFEALIENTITHSPLLDKIKNAYEDSLTIRDKRMSQFITQDKVFGVSVRKQERDDKLRILIKEKKNLEEENLKLSFEITKMKKEINKSEIFVGMDLEELHQDATNTDWLRINSCETVEEQIKDDKFTDYLTLMRERDARYTLYFENVALHLKLRELDGSSIFYSVDDSYGDPVILRIALERCREQLSVTQNDFKRMKEEYSETVPIRQHDALNAKCYKFNKTLDALRSEHDTLQTEYKRISAQKNSLEEELREVKERCGELERAGTPRPRWELCGDFISGGRERWWQLANGLSSRDMLRVLLKELGPAAESEHLEYFDALGTAPWVVSPLRAEGRVRNLRLSRREVRVLVTDIWRARDGDREGSLQDYVARYFEERYHQPSVRTEWSYNLCAGAEQMLDEPAVKVFWGALLGRIAEDVYWGLRAHWCSLREHLHANRRDGETVTIEEFERIARATFPLKSEIDIKNLTDVVRKQLKMKISTVEIHLDKLFYENEEGFDRSDLARELYRQRQLAQDKYIREVVAELGGKHANRNISIDNLKRAFAIVDPAIEHERMQRHLRWSFPGGATLAPLRAVARRLAAGDVERTGPRQGRRRRTQRAIVSMPNRLSCQ